MILSKIVVLLSAGAASAFVTEERDLKKYGKSPKGKGKGKGGGSGGGFPSSNLQDCAFANPTIAATEM